VAPVTRCSSSLRSLAAPTTRSGRAIVSVIYPTSVPACSRNEAPALRTAVTMFW
jgi:hypothetical protein